jgi:hypothetical protein
MIEERRKNPFGKDEVRERRGERIPSGKARVERRKATDRKKD